MVVYVSVSSIEKIVFILYNLSPWLGSAIAFVMRVISLNFREVYILASLDISFVFVYSNYNEISIYFTHFYMHSYSVSLKAFYLWKLDSMK